MVSGADNIRERERGAVFRKWFRRAAIAILVIFIALGAGLWSWWQWALKPYSASGKTQVLVVMPGATAYQIGLELEKRQLIRDAWVFSRVAQSRQVDNKLRPGDYYVSSSMSPSEIVDLLLKGQDVDIRVTIPEGYTTDQIISLLVQKGLGSKDTFTSVVTKDSFSYSFLQGAPAGIHRLEGYLFPDTYFIMKGTGPHEIIDLFLQRFNQELTPETQSTLTAQKLSIHDWTILASIVEREAKEDKDRPLIASVLFNRLDKHMKLEVDATVQFALGVQKPVLYDKDLQTPSPYNTYLHYGLPPGPISNPGDASLQAVLHPVHTDYLYYLAKKDGYHVFAKTFAEQLQNQKKYQ